MRSPTVQDKRDPSTPGPDPTGAERHFEERADYIGEEDLRLWDVTNELNSRVRDKLIGRGAKLIVGPRGCGKTHQMRLAHLNCIQQASAPLSAYVSFSRYYRLEPMLRSSPAAIKRFHSWVLAKVILALGDTAKALNIQLPDVELTKFETFVAELETGHMPTWHQEFAQTLTVARVLALVDSCVATAKRHRAILLMDDAALVLTPEYMVEFFETFRALKTATISPKASVYPGSTEYGPRFHVGHDAESVSAWISVEAPDYPSFMESILQSRTVDLTVNIPAEVVQLFKYAAFGLPRAFLFLLQRYRASTAATTQAKINAVLEEHTSLLRSDYSSLKRKMPQYRSFISIGDELFNKVIHELRVANAEKTEKQITIGLQQDDSLRARRMLRFLMEAGLLFELPAVKHGEDREYLRFIPHLAFLIQQRAFGKGRGQATQETVRRLGQRSAKHPVRRTFASLIGVDFEGRLKLDSPPCASCDAVRLSDDQRFCHNCGKELVVPSTYVACMSLSIDELPIPAWQKERIKSETAIRKLADIVSLPDPATELKKAWQIGHKRAETIIAQAKRFVEEFLER